MIWLLVTSMYLTPDNTVVFEEKQIVEQCILMESEQGTVCVDFGDAI
jgi:hypothetical protein